MSKLIIEDLRYDKYEEQYKTHTFEKTIKEKLNIWFSLYNYFTNPINEKNMTMEIEKHRQMILEVASGSRNVSNDEEFAFTAGQVIFYVLSKSKSGDKSYSRLEPFLQKSKYEEFRKALKNAFDAYKHENFSKKFSNPFANVMDYKLQENELKELTPLMLAGFFSDCVLFSDKKDEDTDNQ